MRRRPDTSTLAVHGGLEPDPHHGSVGPPLVPSSIFALGNPAGYEYGREGNPTWERLERALGALERGERCVALSAGIAAIAAVLELVVGPGSRVVAPRGAYSGTVRLLREHHDAGRLEAVFVDSTDTAAVAAACDRASLLLLETITNPLLTVPDLPACIEAAHAAGALVAVDSTLATPVAIRPLELGADAVVHSLTKYVGGHSDLILGAVVTRDPGLAERLASHRTRVGSIPGQLEAWLALRGLRTLDVRVRRQMATALTLAERLERRPGVTRVRYPGLAGDPCHDRARRLLEGGFGAVLSIEVDGGAGRADAVCRATRLWTHATSLGGMESTLERRARYPLDAEVCDPSLLRLSCGLEHPDDLWDDLDQALAATAS